MTGTRNVNNLLGVYHAVTLLFLLLIAIYDAKHHKIRNAALLALFLWCLVSIPVTIHVLPAVPLYYMVLRCSFGFVTGFFLLLFVSITTNGSIGGGDIKFAGILGFLYGAVSLLTILLIACCIALIHALLHGIFKRKRIESIPFAPYLFLGCSISTLPQLFT